MCTHPAALSSCFCIRKLACARIQRRSGRGAAVGEARVRNNFNNLHTSHTFNNSNIFNNLRLGAGVGDARVHPVHEARRARVFEQIQ